MPNDGTQRLIELLEKAVMIQLHSMGVAQGDIAKMLNKSKSDVNKFLKPIAKGKR
jgi:predicted transcriptional regulator